jgi:hypothetical protein
MADALLITLHPLGEESTAGSSAPVDIGSNRTALLLEAVVSVIGTTLDLVIESAPSADGPWEAVDSFGFLERAGTLKKAFGPCRRFVRATWTPTGNATFSLQGEAHVLYAGLPDLDTGGVRPEALEDIPKASKIHALLMATADLDSAFRTRFKLPLVAWGEDYCFRHRGFDPEAGSDALVVADGGLLMGDGRATAIERWLRDVALNQVHPDVTDTTPTKREGGARVKSRPRRDYDDC